MLLPVAFFSLFFLWRDKIALNFCLELLEPDFALALSFALSLSLYLCIVPLGLNPVILEPFGWSTLIHLPHHWLDLASLWFAAQWLCLLFFLLALLFPALPKSLISFPRSRPGLAWPGLSSCLFNWLDCYSLMPRERDHEQRLCQSQSIFVAFLLLFSGFWPCQMSCSVGFFSVFCFLLLRSEQWVWFIWQIGERKRERRRLKASHKAKWKRIKKSKAKRFSELRFMTC